MLTDDSEGDRTTEIWREITAILALILWSIQLIPQIYKNYKSKSTFGLSPLTFAMWGLANALVGANSFVTGVVIPIFIQPQLFAALSLICLTQCYHYPLTSKSPPPLYRSILLYLALIIILFSLESIWIILITYSSPNPPAFTIFYGYIGPLITSLGFLPQYYRIIKLQTARGVSLTFVALDLLGGTSAIISLTLHDQFQWSVASIYIAVMTLELGLVLLHLYYHPPSFLSSLFPFTTTSNPPDVTIIPICHHTTPSFLTNHSTLV